MNTGLVDEILQTTTQLKEDQRKIIAKLIFKIDTSNNKPLDILYEIIGLLNNKYSFEKIKKDLLACKYYWDSDKYKKYREARELKDCILEKPPEIKEGEMECPKCKQKKVLIIEMQTRSADEGYTYYKQCFNPNCKAITK